MGVDRSRSLKLTAGVSTDETSEMEAHLDGTTVVVTVDPAEPLAILTTRVLLTTLRRGLGQLVLVADGAISATDVESLAESVLAIDPDRPLSVVNPSNAVADNAVRVHVGPSAATPAIRITPEGYGAHIASSPKAVIRPTRPANPIGAVYTAALGAAEVFKHTARVLPQRHVIHDHLRFCPFSLTDDFRSAPDLPDRLSFDLTLVGVGAIGTGIVLLLDALPAEGRLIAIDPQRFAPENLATYSIGDQADAAGTPWKVDLAQQVLAQFDVTPVRDRVGELIVAVDRGEVRWTETVLTGLDSPEARRDAQRLWPDRLIDGQTGDTMLGICDHRHGLDPCLMCIFPVDRSQPSGADAVAEQLGLPLDLLADPNATLAPEHLDRLTEEQQERLRPHLGKPVCGLARATGLTDLDAGSFMPSIPFVSLQAACLSVSRLVGTQLGSPPAANFVQYDGLFGPQAATLQQMQRRPGCACQNRATSINAVRQRRRGV
ncbi:MAG: hypothetical protein ACLQRH_15145 [Acidimicrobiales bacterium]